MIQCVGMGSSILSGMRRAATCICSVGRLATMLEFVAGTAFVSGRPSRSNGRVKVPHFEPDDVAGGCRPIDL